MQIVSPKFTFLFLRISLGIVFFWFGILKLFNVSPVLYLVKIMPVLAESQLFFFALSLLEIIIGIAFFTNRFVKIASIVMIFHLLIASASTLWVAGFSPRFPVLSLEGEFVIKNLVLISAGLLLISEKTEEKTKTS